MGNNEKYLNNEIKKKKYAGSVGMRAVDGRLILSFSWPYFVRNLVLSRWVWIGVTIISINKVCFFYQSGTRMQDIILIQLLN
jgi:hypothetical protein